MKAACLGCKPAYGYRSKGSSPCWRDVMHWWARQPLEPSCAPEQAFRKHLNPKRRSISTSPRMRTIDKISQYVSEDEPLRLHAAYSASCCMLSACRSSHRDEPPRVPDDLIYFKDAFRGKLINVDGPVCHTSISAPPYCT